MFQNFPSLFNCCEKIRRKKKKNEGKIQVYFLLIDYDWEIENERDKRLNCLKTKCRFSLLILLLDTMYTDGVIVSVDTLKFVNKKKQQYKSLLDFL